MRCEIIAEIGQNHNGDMTLAKELIHAAKENGADVAKFQLFNAPALFPTKEQGNEWYDYNCKTEISRDDLFILVEECKKVDIEFMSSAFDVERIGWLEELGVKRHKVASRSINDDVLMAAYARINKPLIISLGLWKGKEFPNVKSKGGVDFLYCVCKYPAPLIDMHFERIVFGQNSYAGFSDHTIGIAAPVTAIARGAKIIEKHFTLDQKMHGPDHQGSMTPQELRLLSSMRDEVAACLGDVEGIGKSSAITGTEKAFVLQS